MAFRFNHAAYTCLSVGLLSAACSAGSDEPSGLSEDAIRITPTGTNAAPTVVFKLPTGLTPATVELATYTINADRQGLDVATSVAVGTVNLAVHVSSNSYPYDLGKTQQPLAVQVGNAYTVDLTTVELKQGVQPVHIATTGVSNKWGTVTPYWRGKPIPLMPAPTKVYFGVMDGLTIAGQPGTAYAVNTDDFTKRQAVRIVAPSRELEDCSSWTYRVDGIHNGTVPRASNVAVGTGMTAILGYNPEVWGAAYDSSATPAAGTSQYRLTVSGTSAILPMSPVGGPAVDFTVGRIDVDHVRVTNSDGTTTNVPGTYVVFAAKADGTFESSSLSGVPSCPTNAGVDVVPGKYKVVVSYTVVEGPKKAEYVVDVQ